MLSGWVNDLVVITQMKVCDRNDVGVLVNTIIYLASASKSKHVAVKDDGIRRCLYCSTKVTAMWRRGPEGGGTLCNGCGLLWEEGKILKGAPIISKQEERQRLREQWEKAQELHEEEERDRELQRHKQEASKLVKSEKTSKVGYYAAQILQQKHQGIIYTCFIAMFD